MHDLPSNRLTDNDIKLLQDCGDLIVRGLAVKEDPTKLRLVLVEIQAKRFEVGRRWNVFKGHARDKFTERYSANKSAKLSPNAAYKEAEADPIVVEYKNSRDLFETAYEVMDSFVTVNQSSMKVAVEEAKNTL